jgi:dTDP-4-amino-4,6-dideoxygalactose transaminase
MKLIQAARASAILYNLLAARADSRPWLLPANICPIVPMTFFKARVPFLFVDISPATLHMDLNRAGEKITRGEFGGLLFAHPYGAESTPPDFFSQIKSLDPNLLILDDRCLCVPDLESIHTAADVILYSTGYAKIAELGFGGYAFLRDDLEYRSASLPFNPANHDEMEKSYKQAIQKRERFVYRDSDWLQIDPTFPAWYDYSRQIETRKKASLIQRQLLNQIYESRLPKEIQLLSEYQTWRFNIRVKNKSQILGAIFDAGLFASSHYASLAGIMADGSAPHAEALADEIINLFNDEHFDEEKAQQTCDIVLRNL